MLLVDLQYLIVCTVTQGSGPPLRSLVLQVPLGDIVKYGSNIYSIHTLVSYKVKVGDICDI